MLKTEYRLRSKVWKYPGMAGWRFLTLTKSASASIKKDFGKRARGWGSLPVTVTIGKTTWKTSIFPDSQAGAYLLPLKANVRKREQINDKDSVLVSLHVRNPLEM